MEDNNLHEKYNEILNWHLLTQTDHIDKTHVELYELKEKLRVISDEIKCLTDQNTMSSNQSILQLSGQIFCDAFSGISHLYENVYDGVESQVRNTEEIEQKNGELSEKVREC